MSVVGVSSAGPTVPIRPGRSTGWWGMVGLMVTEGMLFSLLIFIYFYFAAGDGPWPPEGLPMPELRSSAIRSLILLGSSLPMVLSERALEKGGNLARSAVWSFLALAMAGAFLIGHIQEQFKLFHELSPTENVYGTAVVTILNFHALHLVVGMIILAVTLVHLLRGKITPERPAMLKLSGMYWHFVDVIWVFVYASLYLSPHVLGRG